MTFFHGEVCIHKAKVMPKGLKAVKLFDKGVFVTAFILVWLLERMKGYQNKSKFFRDLYS